MDDLIQEAIAHSLIKTGYTCIRPHQKEILEKALSGQDCLFVAPTGSGKSLIFEAFPSALSFIRRKEGDDIRAIVVVISPLISLMKMQAKDLKRRGISAAYLQVSMISFSKICLMILRSFHLFF